MTEHPTSDEQSPLESTWMPLRPADYATQSLIESGQVSWQPGQMPNYVEINVDYLNQLINQLEFPPIKLGRYTPPRDKNSPSIGSHQSGIATASQTALGQSAQESNTNMDEETLNINIDFDALLAKGKLPISSKEGQEAFAKNIEAAFRKEVRKVAVEKLLQRMKIDAQYLILILSSLVGASLALKDFETIYSADKEIAIAGGVIVTMWLIGIAVIIKSLIAGFNFDNDEVDKSKYNKKLYDRALKKLIHESTIDKEKLKEAFNEEYMQDFFKELYTVPLQKSAQKLQGLMTMEVDQFLNSQQIFRSTKTSSK